MIEKFQNVWCQVAVDQNQSKATTRFFSAIQFDDVWFLDSFRWMMKFYSCLRTLIAKVIDLQVFVQSLEKNSSFLITSSSRDVDSIFSPSYPKTLFLSFQICGRKFRVLKTENVMAIAVWVCKAIGMMVIERNQAIRTNGQKKKKRENAEHQSSWERVESKS